MYARMIYEKFTIRCNHVWKSERTAEGLKSEIRYTLNTLLNTSSIGIKLLGMGKFGVVIEKPLRVPVKPRVENSLI